MKSRRRRTSPRPSVCPAACRTTPTPAPWRSGASGRARAARAWCFSPLAPASGPGLSWTGSCTPGPAAWQGRSATAAAPRPTGPPTPPVGFGKAGSFEGFCSGGGLAELGRAMALEAIQKGTPPAYCPGPEALGSVTALRMAQAAEAGGPGGPGGLPLLRPPPGHGPLPAHGPAEPGAHRHRQRICPQRAPPPGGGPGGGPA